MVPSKEFLKRVKERKEEMVEAENEEVQVEIARKASEIQVEVGEEVMQVVAVAQLEVAKERQAPMMK